MKKRGALLLTGILVGVLGLVCQRSGTQSTESAQKSAKTQLVTQDGRDKGKVKGGTKSLETAKMAADKSSETCNQLKVKKGEGGLTLVERKGKGGQNENCPFNSAPVSQDDLASAPKSVRYPSLEVHAYRSVKLPPRTKGGADGELREWLIKPSQEGYEHHLEEEYYPDDKGAMVLVSTKEYVANQVTLTIDGDCSDEEFAKRVASFGGRVKPLMTIEKGRRLVAVDVPEITLDTVAELTECLGGDKDASGITPDYVNHATLTPNDTSFSSQWGMTKIKAPQAWNIRTDAQTVLVAVLDSGIYYNHVDLNGNMWTNPNQGGVSGFFSDRYGAKCIGGVKSGDPLDDNGHGTHCAGVIGAVGNNSKGVAGVAWKAKLMALKFLNSSGSGYDSDAIILMDYARQQNANIISCSFGGAGYNSSMYSALSTLRNNGIIVVCAAGNDGTSNEVIPHYPASYSLDNIVAVANTTSSDILSSSSCYGATSVDIAAPGDSIYSTYNSSTTSYISMSGTSMATPHVAGALALVKAHFSSDNYLSLIQRLYNGGDSLSVLSGKVSTGKRLNVLGALSSVVPPAPQITASKGTYTDKVVITWPAVSGATHYRVYRSSSSSASSASVLSGWQTACTFNDTTGSQGVTYYYFAKAATSSSGANASGYSAYSSGWRTAVVTYPDAWDPNDNTITGTTNELYMSTTERTQFSHGMSANDLYDFYKVYLTAGKRYVFESTGEYDMYGELYNTTSTNTSARVAYNDDGGTNLNFRIDYTASSTRYHYLRVRRYSVGSVGWYNLKYYQVISPDAWDPDDNTASGGTLLTPTTTQQTHGPHTLTSSDQYDFFKIYMTAGRTYTFESTYGSGEYGGDMYGELFSSTSATASYRVAYDDDSGSQTLQFKIVYTPTSTGYYYLRVRRYSVGDGQYSLKYSMTVPATHDLVYYKRSGMPSAVYVANADGMETLVGSTTFTTNDTIYVHYAFTDATDNDIDSAFSNKVELLRYTSGGSYSVIGDVYDDYANMGGGMNWRNAGAVYITNPTVGSYGVRITLNSPRTITETNYVNNVVIVPYTVTAPMPQRRLVSLAVEGRSTVPAGTSADYTARATFSDGTSQVVTPRWMLSPTSAPATIDVNGHLTARDVSVNQSFTVTASYTFDGETQTGTKMVTVTAGGTSECPFGATVQYPITPMTVFAEVMIDGEHANEGDVLGAFVDDELRGRVELNANGRRAINIYVASPGEVIRFRTWSRGDGEVYACTTPLSGVIGGERGSPSNPYLIECASSDPFTVPATYPNPPMTILARVVIKGQPAERGDVVGVFSGSELRAKGFVHMESGIACVTLAPSIEQSGETLTFKVWDASEEELANAIGTLRGEIGGEAGTPSNRYLIEVTDSVTQTINLNGSGWQFISVNVVPDDNAIRTVLSSVLSDVDRVTCGDLVFRPAWSDIDNTLLTIDPGKGYWLHRRTTGSKDLQVIGAPADVVGTTISLGNGWNAIGYLPQQPGQIRVVFANAIASGKISRVTAGDQVFNPTWSDFDNTLSVMRPGIGYWVRTTAPMTFTYVEPTGSMTSTAMSIIADEDDMEDPWGPERDTDPVMGGCTFRSELKLWGQKAEYGDAIVAAFAGTSTIPCCVAKVNQEGRFAMNINKLPPFELRFEVWDSRARKFHDAAETIAIVNDDPGDKIISVPGTPPSYNVVFSLVGETAGNGTHDGGGDLTQTVQRCANAIEPIVKADRGYKFVCWDEEYTNIKCDTVIRAVYDVAEPVTYDVVYKPGSYGIGAEQTVLKNEGEALTLEGGIFTREGYTQTGWSVNESGSAKDYELGAPYTTDAPVELFPCWTANKYVVSFDANEGMFNPGEGDDLEVTFDQKFGVLPVPKRRGYGFDGWQIENTQTKVDADTVLTIARNINLVATWKEGVYSVFFDPGRGTVDVGKKDVTFGHEFGDLPVPSCRGFTFVNWTNAVGGVVMATSVVDTDEDIHLFAKWSANRYTVTLDADNGTFSPGESGEVIVSFDDVFGALLPTPNRVGYTFGGWTNAMYGVVSADTVVSVDADDTLYAKWTANVYTVSFDPNGGEFDFGGDNQTVTFDQKFGQLPVPHRRGYGFDGWQIKDTQTKVDSDTVLTVEIMPTPDDVTLVAVWKEGEFSVFFNPGAGSVSVSQKAVTFGRQYGALPVPTYLGHTFVNWTNAVGEVITATTVVDADGDIQLFADWNANAYTVRFNANNGRGGTYEQSFVYGREQALKANGFAAIGAVEFYGWAESVGGLRKYTDGQVVSNLTAEADGIVTLFAVWRAVPDPVTGLVIENGTVTGWVRKTTTEVVIPAGVTAIAEGVFAGSDVTKVVIPASVKQIGWGLFVGCTQLQYVFFEGDAPQFPVTVGTKSFYSGCASDVATYVKPDSTGWKDTTTALPTVWPTNVSNAYDSAPIKTYLGTANGNRIISLDGNGGMVSVAIIVYDGTATFGSLPDAKRRGYNFDGWFKSLEDDQPVIGTDIIPDDLMVLYAKWTQNPVPQLDANIRWKLNYSTGTFFGRLELECVSGDPTVLGEVRYLFQDRADGSKLWSASPTARTSPAPVVAVDRGELGLADDAVFRYVLVDETVVQRLRDGNAAAYGIQSGAENADGNVATADRKIELYMKTATIPVSEVNMCLGWLSWEANGETNYMAVGELPENQATLVHDMQTVPYSVATVNRALAFGSGYLMGGSDPNCEIVAFEVRGGKICGKVAIVMDTTERVAPGGNVRATLYGATELADGFTPCGKLELNADGTFETAIPSGKAFFKVKLEVIEIVK